MHGAKGMQTRQKIIEATILSVAKYGFEFSTVSTVSKLAKTNRGLIVHYFKNTKKLMNFAFETVVKYVIEASSDFMITRTDISDPIERYFKSTFHWMQLKPHYGQFVFSLLTRAQYDESSKRPVEQIFSSGRNRVEKLILQGIESGIYKSENPKECAFQIHSMLVGHLMMFLLNQKDLETPMELSIKWAKEKLLSSFHRPH